MVQEYRLRQPIVTIAGHVDHGKTTILDSIRRTAIAEAEAGGITQKISFTLFPSDKILGRCPIIEKSGLKLEIPGFLFIDTPGHAAFTNLRKRGGSLADIAILVIDINEGIKPQTAEVIEILKIHKTPFVIALNKIDRISGWRKQSESLKQNLEMQAQNIKQEFQEKILTLQGNLHTYGFQSDLYYYVKDFTTKVALVPCSGKTGEGIPEILMMLCGLSQKFLKGRLRLSEKAKGVILEVKKERAMNYIEAILHDGTLKRNQEIAIASFDKTLVSRIRTLEEILPLSNKFKPVYSCGAATGIRMQLTTSEEILSGMPFQTFQNQQEIENLSKEVRDRIKIDKQGIIVKADSLGSLEALLLLLRQEKIKVSKAGIGQINKSDIISAQANLEKNPIDAVVVGFNVGFDEEAKEFAKNIKNIKLLEDEVIYKLIENLQEFQEQKTKEIEKAKLMSLASIFKLKILQQHVFRNSNPAIFGVSVQGGALKQGVYVIDEKNQDIGKIKTLQSKGSTLDKATAGQEVAVSIPNTNFERKIKESSFLYSDINEKQFRQFKDNKSLLSSEEISILQEIAKIKRVEKPTWGI
jgi:translation initiation factor 5B